MTTRLELESAEGNLSDSVTELVGQISGDLLTVGRSIGSLPSSVVLRALTFHPSIDHFKALELIKSFSTDNKPTRLWQSI